MRRRRRARVGWWRGRRVRRRAVAGRRFRWRWRRRRRWRRRGRVRRWAGLLARRLRRRRRRWRAAVLSLLVATRLRPRVRFLDHIRHNWIQLLLGRREVSVQWDLLHAPRRLELDHIGLFDVDLVLNRHLIADDVLLRQKRHCWVQVISLDGGASILSGLRVGSEAHR